MLKKIYVAKLNGQVYATYSAWNTATAEPSFSSGSPLITTYRYDAAGDLDTVTLPNGVTTDYDNDALGRVEYESVKKGSNLIATYDYGVDVRGKRETALETDYNQSGAQIARRNFTWFYDELDRLIEEKLDVGANDSVDETINSTYDAKDQLGQEVSSTRGTTLYYYDEPWKRMLKPKGSTCRSRRMDFQIS